MPVYRSNFHPGRMDPKSGGKVKLCNKCPTAIWSSPALATFQQMRHGFATRALTLFPITGKVR